MHRGSISFYSFMAGVPEENVLEPFLYLLVTTDKKRSSAHRMMWTVVISTGVSQSRAAKKLQHAYWLLVSSCSVNYKINLNESKSVHVTYTLRQHNNRFFINLNGRPIHQAGSIKCLRVHLENRFNRFKMKHYVRQKTEQIMLKHCLYTEPVFNLKAKLSLYSK